MKKLSLLLIVIAIITFNSAIEAQTTTGTIAGTVQDESGAVLPGVTVTATSTEMGTKRSAITDDSGYFKIQQLSIGSYEVQAELSGFNTVVRKGLQVLIGQDTVVNLDLKVGEISEKVTVTGEAPLVETTSSTLAAVVGEKEIRDLPLNGRSFTQLALLQEAVVSPVNHQRGNIGNEGQKISINGTRVTQTSFLLDGTEIRNQLNTTPGSVAGVLLGVDTVREFNVITSVASAEFGRFTGGVVNAVTRSGTNSFNGSLFEFHRNSALDARNFFDTRKPNFIRNQFGFTLGGPIRPDHTFFFGSYEALRDRLTETAVVNVPNANARLGILPASAGGDAIVDPRIQPYLATYPLPNGRDNGNGTGEYVYPNVRPTNEHYFVVKIDQQFSDSDSLFGRFTFDQGEKTRLEDMALWGIAARSRSQFFTLEEKKIFSPNLLNTARFSFNRTQNSDEHFPFNIGSLPENLKFVPQADRDFGAMTAGGLAPWGPSVGNRKSNVLNKFEYADNVAWTVGRHSLKLGGNFTRFQYNFLQTARSRGTYAFPNLRALLLAQPQSFDVILGAYIRTGIRESIGGVYIQDDFRMRPGLTWNLGLRYEAISNPTEVAGRIGNLDRSLDPQVRVGNPMLARNPSLKAFAPRVGVAWSPFASGKTSIRGGAGIFYDLIMPVNYYVWPQFNVPFFRRVTIANPAFLDGFNRATAGTGTVPGLWALLEPEQGYVTQYNLTLQQQLAAETVVTVGYQGSRGTHLSRFIDANTAVPQNVGGRLFNPVDSRRRNPNFGQILASAWDANSYYNAFKFSLQRRFSQGFQLQSAYTYGRSVDDASNVGPFDQPSVSAFAGNSNVPDDHKFNRGLSYFDVRHVWSLNTTAELPFGPGKRFGADLRGLAAGLVGGWQLSGIVTLATGGPVHLLMSFENSRSRATVDLMERPDLKPGASNSPVLSDGRDPNRYFDTGAFAVPPAGFFGNLGHHTLILPGVATLDLAITKNTQIGERRSVQFRAEGFNILNRANFGVPDVTVFTNATGVPSATAGRIRTTSTTARQVQFGLKILF